MADESGEQKQSPMIMKGAVFGLSEQDVLSTIEEAKQNSKDDMVIALTSGSPAEVLVDARRIYDRAVELEVSGTSRKELARQLQKEFLTLEYIYWLLRKQPWGYRLGQAIFAAKMLEEEEMRYGPQSDNSK